MSKDKKARRAALRHFLTTLPESFDRMATWLGRLVMLAAAALAAMVLHWAFAHHRAPPHEPGLAAHGQMAARDLARLADGRHAFDLSYDLVLDNRGPHPLTVASIETQALLRDPVPDGAMLDLGEAPAPGQAAGAPWHRIADRKDAAAFTLAPGQWRRVRAHYRVIAASEQIAAIAIGYTLQAEHAAPHGDAHGEDVALGAVVRAHCPLGITVVNGGMASSCAR